MNICKFPKTFFGNFNGSLQFSEPFCVSASSHWSLPSPSHQLKPQQVLCYWICVKRLFVVSMVHYNFQQALLLNLCMVCLSFVSSHGELLAACSYWLLDSPSHQLKASDQQIATNHCAAVMATTNHWSTPVTSLGSHWQTTKYYVIYTLTKTINPPTKTPEPGQLC